MPESDATPVTLGLPSRQLNLVDQFHREEGLASREAAIALLLDIGLKAVTRGGRRFQPRRRTQVKFKTAEL